MLELAHGDALVTVDPAAGGRITALKVGDLDLLRTPDDDPGGTHWGAFVMAPWAGRTRHGRFTFAGVEHELDVNAPPHAIHGTVRDQPWTVEEASATAVRMTCDFGARWPFPGWAEHELRLTHDGLDLTLSLHSREGDMPAVGGWHPWWRRELSQGEPATLDLPAGAMYERDEEGIATTDVLRPPPPGPWDDCFTDFHGTPTLRWTGAAEVAIASDCRCVVVYDEPSDSICVEPQSGPPDALNHTPDLARPGQPVVVHSTWSWRT